MYTGKSLGFLAICAIAGVVLSIVSWTKNTNAAPLGLLCAYIFSFIPFFLCGARESHNNSTVFDEEERSIDLQTVGLFLSGVALGAGPSAALVLYRSAFLTKVSLILTLVSCVVLDATLLASYFLKKEEEDDFGF